MWPYATRGSRFLGDISEISPSALEAEDSSTNAVPIKLFLPARLKLELQDLADAAKQPLSDYLRAVLARQLLGERFFREWQAALAKANAEAARHESDIVLSR